MRGDEDEAAYLELIHTMPASMFRATRWALVMFSVNRAAPRPYVCKRQ
jgi:hypothetical protein